MPATRDLCEIANKRVKSCEFGSSCEVRIRTRTKLKASQGKKQEETGEFEKRFWLCLFASSRVVKLTAIELMNSAPNKARKESNSANIELFKTELRQTKTQVSSFACCFSCRLVSTCSAIGAQSSMQPSQFDVRRFVSRCSGTAIGVLRNAN